MWAAHPWERMERSLIKGNSEKNEFGGGMNGKGTERSGITGYWNMEIWVWWWNELLAVGVIDGEWLDRHGDGCVEVWRLGGQWASHKALGVEQFSLGFRFGWRRDFDGGFYKDFVWPCKGGGVGGYICIHILGHHITPVHQSASHVFSMVNVTFSHHGRWLKCTVGDLYNWKLLMIVVFPHHAHSQELQSTDNQHAKDVDNQTNCYPMKLGETTFLACEFPSKRYDKTVIDGGSKDHADGVKEWKKGWRNLEGAGNAKVHSVALEDKRVPIWLYTVENTMPMAQMGCNLIIDLSSSTWVTVQSL